MTTPIVVIAGQSNAAGRGTLVLIPNYQLHGYDDPFPSVQMIRKIGDSPQDPLVWIDETGPDDLDYIHSGNGVFGVEMSMCRRLHTHGYTHALAQYAIGSTSLGTHWKTTGTFPTGDNLFTQFLAFLDGAETSLSGTIAELVWIQGEADAGNSGHAAAYATNMSAFITAFRASFPAVPITINRLHLSNGGAFTSTVRTAQDTIARTVPGVRIFSVDDLPLDGAHFTSASFMALGERFADQILAGREDQRLFAGPRSGFRTGPKFSSGHNFSPVASFTTSAAGLTITFTDTSVDLEGSNARWAWDFGDSSTSTSQNPQHAYAAEGDYTVTLTVSDSKGATSTTSATVSVILWDIDATSNKAVPSDATQWSNFVTANSLAVGSPEHLWLFQDASGNLAAAIGGKTLTMTGTPLYQQSETGWTRKFITANTAAAQNRSAANATMVASTTSVLLLVLARIAASTTAAHQRASYGQASSNAFEGIANSPNIRYRTGANATNGSTTHAGAVRPFILLHDTSGSGRMALFSDIEKVSPTYAARSGTTVTFTFSLGTDATTFTAFGYAAAWSGATIDGISDANVKAIMTSMGFSVTGW